MMGSLSPFQDLNLLPDPAVSAAGAPSLASTSHAETTATPIDQFIRPTPAPTTNNCTFSLKTPKMEPKIEPFDSMCRTLAPAMSQDPMDDFFSSPASANYSNSDLTRSSSFSEPKDISTSLPSVTPSGQENLYTEFYRISELFRSAFAKGLQTYGNLEVLDPDSRAIVPVPQGNQVSPLAVSKRHFHQRSSELVRVTDLGAEDQLYFRDVVRRTRMLFDSLRILSMTEDEKCKEPGFRRARGDLRASSMMRNRGLWLNRDKRIVGSIPGVYIGDLFLFRMELCIVGLHSQAQAGIDYVPASHSSNGEPIATSIIVSGGYEDDEDAGDMIIYTGQGGQDKCSRQCANQKLEGGNLALERSMHYGIEVRVIRGIKYDGSITAKVYVYDGLYKIVDCWFDVGKSGFGVFKYKLLRIDGQTEMGSSVLRFAETLRNKPLSIRPSGYFSLDISMKKENVPILLFNDIDNDQLPLYFEYTVKPVFPLFAFHHSGSATGCSCVSGCSNDCFCALKNGGELAYDQSGFLLRGKPVIFECGPDCRCPPHCRNRATQRGLKHRLEVFRSRETGWGVRSLDVIHAGSFICEYTGVFLTRVQAQVVSMNGDSLIYPSRFSDRWAEWGDISQIDSNYVRPSYPSVPPLDFAVDVSKMRNVACYLCHSTTPNVMVQFVLYDHNNLMFPHIMVFAMENIPPMRELSLDYGVADECTGKLAICN